MSDPSRRPNLWRRFRSLPLRVQIASWIGLAALVIVGAVLGGESGSGNPPTATTQATSTPASPSASAATTSESPPSSPAPTATATGSLEDWRAEHGKNIALVIATANGLAEAIDSGANQTAVARSCDALKNNYRTLLQPIPAPPGPLGESLGKWDSALDAIYYAQSKCSGGVISKPDLSRAAVEARNGAALLNEVLGPAS